MDEDSTRDGNIDTLKNLNFPFWLKKNILVAIGKGLGKIILEATDIPVNYLRNFNEKIKLQGEIRREFIKKAASMQLDKVDDLPELANRALENYGVKLIDEQFNRDLIGFKAINELNERVIPDEMAKNQLSDDWLTAFWNLAATKSENDIQGILSKILANEILSPGSLSLHTLQTLSILDSKVGNAFSRLCNISIDDGQLAYVIHPHVYAFQNLGPLVDYNISFPDLLYLDGANLIRSAETLMVNYGRPDGAKESDFFFEEIDFAAQAARIDVSGEQLNLIFFTQAGKELRKLIKMIPNEDYKQVLINKLGKKLEF